MQIHNAVATHGIRTLHRVVELAVIIVIIILIQHELTIGSVIDITIAAVVNRQIQEIVLILIRRVVPALHNILSRLVEAIPPVLRAILVTGSHILCLTCQHLQVQVDDTVATVGSGIEGLVPATLRQRVTIPYIVTIGGDNRSVEIVVLVHGQHQRTNTEIVIFVIVLNIVVSTTLTEIIGSRPIAAARTHNIGFFVNHRQHRDMMPHNAVATLCIRVPVIIFIIVIVGVAPLIHIHAVGSIIEVGLTALVDGQIEDVHSACVVIILIPHSAFIEIIFLIAHSPCITVAGGGRHVNRVVRLTHGINCHREGKFVCIPSISIVVSTINCNTDTGKTPFHKVAVIKSLAHAAIVSAAVDINPPPVVVGSREAHFPIVEHDVTHTTPAIVFIAKAWIVVRDGGHHAADSGITVPAVAPGKGGVGPVDGQDGLVGTATHPVDNLVSRDSGIHHCGSVSRSIGVAVLHGEELSGGHFTASGAVNVDAIGVQNLEAALAVITAADPVEADGHAGADADVAGQGAAATGQGEGAHHGTVLHYIDGSIIPTVAIAVGTHDGNLAVAAGALGGEGGRSPERSIAGTADGSHRDLVGGHRIEVGEGVEVGGGYVSHVVDNH